MPNALYDVTRETLRRANNIYYLPHTPSGYPRAFYTVSPIKYFDVTLWSCRYTRYTRLIQYYIYDDGDLYNITYIVTVVVFVMPAAATVPLAVIPLSIDCELDDIIRMLNRTQDSL